ncbi:uncharacterized protein At3g06530-like isoform X1 [Papaver somniferum]|uniref:uncharacterized protein At3g06530-like isoform X1 n=1 Tax=Papaver somniferum TaxID=3469 RepID=UPI000E6FA853|nr:uncharacterized protein At3g06530-like isoform X1 [Papaver somniferum]
MELMDWMAVESSSNTELSKTLFLLFLQSLSMENIDHAGFTRLFEVCFPVLKQQWSELESTDAISENELTVEELDKDCTEFLSRILNPPFMPLNTNLLICIFWRLLKSIVSAVAKSGQADNREWLPSLHDLLLFIGTPHLKHILRGKFSLLLVKHNISIASILSKFFTDRDVSVADQVQSLHCITATCSQLSEEKNLETSLQLLLSFPSVLVPLSSENQKACRSKLKSGLSRQHENLLMGEKGKYEIKKKKKRIFEQQH